MKIYTNTYCILLLIIGVCTAIYTEECIGAKDFRILSAVSRDREQVQYLRVQPYAIQMEVPEHRVVESVSKCQGPATQEAAAFHRIGVEDLAVAEVAARLKHRHTGAGVGNMCRGVVDIGRRTGSIHEPGRLGSDAGADSIAE